MMECIEGNEIKYSDALTAPIGVHVDSVNNRVLVGNYGTNEVKILALDTLKITGVITGIPLAATIVSDNTYYYAVYENDWIHLTDFVYQINKTTLVKTKLNFSGVTTARGLFVDMANDRLFVCSYNTSQVFVIKNSDKTPITNFSSNNPVGVHLDLALNKLYVTDYLGNKIYIYNATTYALITTLTTGLNGPYGLSGDANFLIVNNLTGSNMLMINKSDNSIKGIIGGMQGVRFSDISGGNIYTAQTGINRVSEMPLPYNRN